MCWSRLRVKKSFAAAGNFADHKAAVADLRKVCACASMRRKGASQCLLPVEKISVAAGRFADNKAMDPNLMAMHRWVSTAYRRISALWYLWKGGNSHMHKAIHASKAEKMAHIYKLLRRHRWPMITHYFTFRCDPCTCVEHKKGSCNA
jgi:hypothetical protein